MLSALARASSRRCGLAILPEIKDWAADPAKIEAPDAEFQFSGQRGVS
jgi:hypothetical protein